MKTNSCIWWSRALALGCALGFAINSSATVLYDNTTTDLGKGLDPDLYEVGDEIILAGGYDGVLATDFCFQYWTDGVGNNAKAQIRFYENDGGLFNGYATPGTLLYDSGLFGIGAAANATYHLALSVTVPHSFTWSIQFFDLGNGDAGVNLFSPPGAGGNYTDFWWKSPTGWQLLEIAGGTHADFAAKLTSNEGCVPDGGSTAVMSLLGIGLILGLQAHQRRQCAA